MRVTRRCRHALSVGCWLLAGGWLLVSSSSVAWAGWFDLFVSGDQMLERPPVITESAVAPYVTRPLDKLGRGLENILTSPFEWPLTIRSTTKRDGWGRGVLLGPVIGLGRFGIRLGSGVVDVLSFPLPPRQALWVDEPSLFNNDTARATWVTDEAQVAQQQLGFFVPTPPTASPSPE